MSAPANEQDRRRQRRLVVYRAASDVAAKGAMFVVTIGAARRLSRDAFALFAIASTLGWLGAVVADFGIQMHVARAVAQEPGRASQYLRQWLPFRAASGVAVLTASVVAMRLLGVPRAAWIPMSGFAAAYASNGFLEFLFYFFRGLGRSDIESTLTLVQRGAMCGLALAGLWWHPTVGTLALAILLPSAATVWVASLAARDLAASPDSHAISRVHTSIWPEFLTTVAPIGAGIVLSALYFRVDVFLLARWSGEAPVALYASVFRIVDALRLFPAAVLAVTLPQLCRADDIRPLLRVAAPLTAAAIGVVAVLWPLAGLVVQLLYGASFADAAQPFRPLLLAFPLMALNYALTHQLIAWHGHRLYALLCAGALALNVALNAWLIPGSGMTGAAWSTLWTEAFLTVGCLVALVRVGSPQSTAPRLTGDALVTR